MTLLHRLPPAPEAKAPEPNLRHIRLFTLCAEAQSLGTAARALGMTQPAASQALARLELQLGATLLSRPDMRLTPAGRVACARFVSALQALENALQPTGVGLHRIALPQLRAMAAFAAHGSFAGASRVLSQSEPALRRAARELKADLGFSLFIGKTRALQLSPEGQDFARAAQIALREIAGAHSDIAALSGQLAGEIRIGALPLARTALLPDVLAKLANPAIRFDIREGSYETLSSALMRGELDLIVGALREGALPAGLKQERLLDFDLCVIARKDHPVLRDGALHLYPWIVARRGTPSRQVFATLSARLPRPAHESVETGSLDLIRQLIAGSDHLALLSPSQIPLEIESGQFVTLGPPVAGSLTALGVTLRSDWRPDPLQRAVLSALREAARAAGEV